MAQSNGDIQPTPIGGFKYKPAVSQRSTGIQSNTQKAPTKTLSGQHAHHGTAATPIITDTTQSLDEETYSNCCGAGDIYDGNLGNNEGVCADCGEHCEMEANQ